VAGAAVIVAGLVACGGDGGGSRTPSPATDCVVGTYTIAPSNGNGQVGLATTTLPTPLEVEVRCTSSTDASNRLTVSSGNIDWRVATGGGTVNGGTTAQTGMAGRVNWTLGATFGVQTVIAEYCCDAAGPISLTFTATATAPNGCQATVAGTQQSPVNGERVITANEVWKVAGSPHRGTKVSVQSDAVLKVEAGAKVCVAQLEFKQGGTMRAIGTSAAKIVFAGESTTNFWAGLFFFPPTFGVPMAHGPSKLEFVVVENARNVIISNSHPVRMNKSLLKRTLPASAPGFAQFQVALFDGGGLDSTRLDTVFVDGYGAPTNPNIGVVTPAVNLSASNLSRFGSSFSLSLIVRNSLGEGIEMNTGGWQVGFLNCEISGNLGNGVIVRTGSDKVSFSNCNFIDNAGAGILNQSFQPVVAQNNWWDDAAGPAGAHGDGVLGDVDASSPLAAAVGIYAP
jgi:hypothetical protein